MSWRAAAPSVQALVPAWQAAEFIRETLDSLVAQTWPNLSVLIAVDAGSDETAAICSEYAQRNENFSVHVHTDRQGWIGNTNWLLSHASAEYLLFAFHDDVLAPDYVEVLVEALEANPEAVNAFSDVDTYYQDGRCEHRVYTELEGVASPVDRGRRLIWMQGHWSVPNRGVFRSWVAQAIGGLRRHRSGEFSADWAWLTHMSLLGPFVRVPGVRCWKYYKRDSLSRSWAFSRRQTVHALENCLREVRRSRLSVWGKVRLHAAALSLYWRVLRRAEGR